MAGLAVALVLVAAACGGDDSGNGTNGAAGAQEAEGTGDLPGDEIELADGTTATLADQLDGKPMVLNFFASWCAPCRAEMPDFQAVYADVGEEVRFFGLAMNDSADAAVDLVDLTEVQYPWGLDDGSNLFVTFGGRQMPTTVYISADGKVLSTDSGAITESQLRARVVDHFGVES